MRVDHGRVTDLRNLSLFFATYQCLQATIMERNNGNDHVRVKLEEIARLTLQVGSTAVDVASMLADCGENLPFVSLGLKTLQAIHAKIRTVRSNKEELNFLAWRCNLLMAAFILRRQRRSSEKELENRIKQCFKEVHQIVERCCERRWCWWFVKATSDKDQIDSLRERIGVLIGDLGLVSIYNLNNKFDDFVQKQVRFRHQVHVSSSKQF